MIALSIGLIIVSCLIIWKASDGFETASEYLGRNLSEGVRGATINAIGSSIPELLTTVFFLFVLQESDGFSGGVGTTAGSAIFNGMIIPAAVILVVVLKGVTSSISVSRSVLLRDGIALLICEFILIWIVGGDSLTWIHGFVLILLYLIYMVYMITSMKRKQRARTLAGGESEDENEDEEEEAPKKSSTSKNIRTLNLEPLVIKKEIHTHNAWALILLSVVVVGAACFLLVKSCDWLGEAIGMPIYFIAVILASAATSVPDTILSMKDAKKGNYDDAVSNALGSNIFDVCFALGLPLLLFTLIYGPITMSPETVINVTELRILLLLLTVVAFFIYILPKKLGLRTALLLILLYVLFTVYILGRSTDNETAESISVFLRNIDSYIDYIRFWKI